MQIPIPPIILPPLVPPPSVSHYVNTLLDYVHYHIYKFELQMARKRLFEAYIQFYLNDALMEEKKSYFFTTNGYILFLMVQNHYFGELLDDPMLNMKIPEDGAGQFLTYHFLQHAALSFVNAIDVIEPKQSIERATPRIYLGALYTFIQNYNQATVYFKQAEAISASSEGADSILYNISSYNLQVVCINEFVLYINYKDQPNVQPNFEKAELPEIYQGLKTNPRFGPDFDFRLTNNSERHYFFDYKEHDVATMMFNLGASTDITIEPKATHLEEDDFYKYKPQVTVSLTADSVYGVRVQAGKIKEKFYKIMGDCLYYYNACRLEEAARCVERYLGQKLYGPVHVTSGRRLVNCTSRSKTIEELALESYKAQFSKVPQRPLVYIKKKGKK